MEFIPLETKKRKSASLKCSEKNDKNKKQLKKLGDSLYIKNLGGEKSTVKNPKKSFNNEPKKKEVVKKRIENTELSDHVGEKHNKKSKSKKEDNENCNDEKLTEEEKKEKLKLEKWKRLDEKKKNRLFVLRKKKILSESEIKELHHDIKKVIFPRKKKSRWCWAVFASEEKANKAFKSLADNKECFVSKPNPCAKVEMKRKKKMVAVQRRLDAKKKLQTMWS